MNNPHNLEDEMDIDAIINDFEEENQNAAMVVQDAEDEDMWDIVREVDEHEAAKAKAKNTSVQPSVPPQMDSDDDLYVNE